MLRNYIYFLLLLVFSQCTTYRPYVQNNENIPPTPSEEPAFTVFLAGDLGANPSSSTASEKLQKHLASTPANKSALLLLGNQLYPNGLPDSTRNKHFPERAEQLAQKLSPFKTYAGKTVVVPGNRDWAKGKKYGLTQVINQERFIKSYFQESLLFLPDHACPGPVEIPLNNDIVLIIIDTQWWLHQWDRPYAESTCEAKDDYDFLLLLKDAVERYPDKKVIVAAHHPLVSNGIHGGHFSLKNHLIPLPGLGSLVVGFRKLFGTPQDLVNVRYKQMRQAFQEMFKAHPNLMYVSSHDLSLQYHQLDQVHHVVSGSISEAKPIAHHKKAIYAQGKAGFAKLQFYNNGAVYLEFQNREADPNDNTPLFRKKLFQQTPSTPKDSTQKYSSLNYSDSTIQIPISKVYAQASKWKKWTFGKNYRQEWAKDVKFPYLDIGTEKGGLKIIKRGGGQATNSLRLEADNGKQYVLRSIDKQSEKALGGEFKGTVVADIVQDQTSAAHPYAALAVPKLANAAGVNHTNPKYVYLPEDPRLGKYQYSFGGAVYLFEERPDDNWEDADFFGNPKDIDGTSSVIENTLEDNDIKVDQLSVLRHRLFDIWIGDWDRHDDQWRWAEYKDVGDFDKVYQPIPRDRDQVFWLSDGWAVELASHRWGIPKFQGFRHSLRDVQGLNQNARFFDRFFLTEPSLEDWLAVADSLQKRLTDEVIEKALNDIPEEARLHNAEIKAKLIERRKELKLYAQQYYEFLAKTVVILGSDKHERFEINRLNDEETQVIIYKVKKKYREKLHKMYERTFKKSETKEIRLFGLSGQDHFYLKGEVKKGIRVRIIGGGGKDQIIDASEVRSGAKKTIVYDKPKSTRLQASSETKSRLLDKPGINRYDRQWFKYNYLGPVLFLGFNLDDGPFIGGGVNLRTHGFRKEPFNTEHLIKANFAAATASYDFEYKGTFIELFGKLDLVLEAGIRSPNYVRNFFGLGNESRSFVEEENLRFHRVRFQQWLLQPQLRKRWQGQRQSLSLGAFVQSVTVREQENEGRFITDFALNGLDSVNTIGESKYFTGGVLKYNLDTRDDQLIPSQGSIINVQTTYARGFRGNEDNEINFLKIESSAACYLALGSGITIAARLGGAHNFGTFEFFQANTLGGRNNLRGHRNFRFAGRSSIYQNTELRLKLFKLRSFLFNGYLGLIGIHDVGRVWQNGENSNKLHQGYGGGIWLTPARATVLSTTLTTSEDDTVFFIRFGFLF